MQAADIVREARHSSSGLPSPQALQAVAYQEEPPLEDDELCEPHAELRAAVLNKLQPTLTMNDRALIRFLLEQEIACHLNDCETEGDSIHHCGFLLFQLGQLEDLELLWQAKTATFDTWCGFDIQYLIGAGVATTLAYLQTIPQEWAQEAATYIEECRQASDFKHLERYRSAKQKYFNSEETNTTETHAPTQ